MNKPDLSVKKVQVLETNADACAHRGSPHHLTDKEPPQPTIKVDSMTNVHFSEYVKTEWKDGKRLPISIRINSELYKEFKPISKALYGSSCRAVECLMAAVVLAARNKVHFSNTQQPINIGKIVIERNMRPRRALEYVEETTSEVKKVEKTKCKIVLSDVPDYSRHSLEELDRLHRRYMNSGQMGKSALVFAELKKRGHEVS